jgi:hypothetical protein
MDKHWLYTSSSAFSSFAIRTSAITATTAVLRVARVIVQTH